MALKRGTAALLSVTAEREDGATSRSRSASGVTTLRNYPPLTAPGRHI